MITTTEQLRDAGGLAAISRMLREQQQQQQQRGKSPATASVIEEEAVVELEKPFSGETKKKKEKNKRTKEDEDEEEKMKKEKKKKKEKKHRKNEEEKKESLRDFDAEATEENVNDEFFKSSLVWESVLSVCKNDKKAEQLLVEMKKRIVEQIRATNYEHVAFTDKEQQQLNGEMFRMLSEALKSEKVEVAVRRIETILISLLSRDNSSNSSNNNLFRSQLRVFDGLNNSASL